MTMDAKSLSANFVELVDHEINTDKMLASVRSAEAGASLLFVGTTRKMSGGRETQRLEYDCYRPMATANLKEICEKAISKFELIACQITHRLGIVELGQISIAVAVSSAHRGAAFDASKWIMDSVKKSVPIWKKEHWTDGASEWVHHGTRPENI